MRGCPRRWLVVCALALLFPAAAAQATPQSCQQAAAGAGRQMLGRAQTILAGCQRAVARGRLPAGTDCHADPATLAKRRAALRAATDRVLGGCSDADVVALTPGGPCDGVRTAAEFAACLAGSHGAEADALLAVADAARAELAPAAALCAATASREARRFAQWSLRVLQACKQSSRLRAGLAPGMTCRAAPRIAARLAPQQQRAAGRIAAACGAGLGTTPFGAPCSGMAGAPALAACLVDAAATAADRALAAQFPDPSFCGDAGDEVEARIDGLLAQMTLDEKILQMHGGGLSGIARTAGVERLGVPGLTMMDGPRGVGVTGGNATAFPVGIARGATWDPALEARVGDAIGREARAKGVSVILAPTINLLRHPRWGRTQETYSEDTYHMGRMGVGFIRGAQQQVIANPKHFAANSIEDTRFTVDVQVDERTLREVYLPHFRAAVQEADAGSVMSAYNLVNGLHCEENPHLLRDVLKGDWGFRGFVESDWVLGTHHTVPAALAGLDIEMPLPRFYGPALAAAVTAGTVPEAVIDEAVRRIVRAQLCFRLDSDPPVVDPTQVETPAHAAVALDVAQESLVLLKNAGAALPLDRSALGSIAVVGELAAVANLGDRGSSSVSPSHSVAPLDGLRSRAGAVAVDHYAAVPLSGADRAAIAAADAAIVVAGLTYLDEGEGLITTGDRENLAMPGAQDALIAEVAALNPRTIVVLEGSGALLMPWLDDVAAVLMAWYPGQEGGTAIADAVFGDVVPSGKLPMSFPRAEDDLPLFDNVSTSVTYDLFHGYRHLDLAAATPLFPFGFGLSYTTFSYANLRVSPPAIAPYGHVRVTAEVTNTGPVAGADVAQLYVGYPGSRVPRAVRELKGFSRVDLAPGETRTVVFDLRAADLMFWDTAADGWELEPITYTLAVGSSSRDLPLSGELELAAE